MPFWGSTALPRARLVSHHQLDLTAKARPPHRLLCAALCQAWRLTQCSCPPTGLGTVRNDAYVSCLYLDSWGRKAKFIWPPQGLLDPPELLLFHLLPSPAGWSALGVTRELCQLRGHARNHHIIAFLSNYPWQALLPSPPGTHLPIFRI